MILTRRRSTFTLVAAGSLTVLLIAACSASGDPEATSATESAVTGACDAHGAAALAWERAHLHDGTGAGCWSDMCGLFAYDAAKYGAGFVPAWLDEPAATADGMMHNAMNAGVFHPWDGSCPCGAILFYEAHGAITTGHVVLCNGNGTVSSSGWPGWPGAGSCGFDGNTSVSISWLSGAEGIPPTGYVLYGGSAPVGGGSGPCAHVSGGGNGLYCGRSRENGFAGGDGNTVYDCEGGRTASTEHCNAGCFTAPAGQNDGCNADPCVHVAAPNVGLYCGASRESGFSGGDTHTLYDCQGGKTVSMQGCPKGCAVAPAGQADHCD